MKKFVTLFLLIVSGQNTANSQTWDDFAEIRALEEVNNGIYSISTLEVTYKFIQGESILIKLDVAKSDAYNNMTKAANPTSKIFNDKSFAQIITSTITEKLKPSGTVDKKNLDHALSNATNSNSLVQTLSNFNPIGSAITSAMSVVNNFFQKKGGLFRFLQGFFTPNYESQIKEINDALKPYIDIYTQMNSITDNAISMTKTYTDLLTTDYNTIKQLTEEYQTQRKSITSFLCNSRPGCDLNSQEYSDALRKQFNTDKLTPSGYNDWRNNKNIVAAVSLYGEINNQIKLMAYHSIAYNEQVKVYLTDWRNLLSKNDLTANGDDSKKIVASIDAAITTIDVSIAGLKAGLDTPTTATSIIDKSIENQREAYFN